MKINSSQWVSTSYLGNGGEGVLSGVDTFGRARAGGEKPSWGAADMVAWARVMVCRGRAGDLGVLN